MGFALSCKMYNLPLPPCVRRIGQLELQNRPFLFSSPRSSATQCILMTARRRRRRTRRVLQIILSISHKIARVKVAGPKRRSRSLCRQQHEEA